MTLRVGGVSSPCTSHGSITEGLAHAGVHHGGGRSADSVRQLCQQGGGSLMVDARCLGQSVHLVAGLVDAGPPLSVVLGCQIRTRGLGLLAFFTLMSRSGPAISQCGQRSRSRQEPAHSLAQEHIAKGQIPIPPGRIAGVRDEALDRLREALPVRLGPGLIAQTSPA